MWFREKKNLLFFSFVFCVLSSQFYGSAIGKNCNSSDNPVSDGAFCKKQMALPEKNAICNAISFVDGIDKENLFAFCVLSWASTSSKLWKEKHLIADWYLHLFRKIFRIIFIHIFSSPCWTKQQTLNRRQNKNEKNKRKIVYIFTKYFRNLTPFAVSVLYVFHCVVRFSLNWTSIRDYFPWSEKFMRQWVIISRFRNKKRASQKKKQEGKYRWTFNLRIYSKKEGNALKEDKHHGENNSSVQ